MDLELKGKSVIVTGGGSNIGRGISLAFAREGTHLTIAEIDEKQGEKVAREAQGAGAASAQVVRTDVTQWESVRAMVRADHARLRRGHRRPQHVGLRGQPRLGHGGDARRIAKAYPLRRLGRADDVAPAVVFLASSAASFITGQTLSVSGGYTMM